MNRAAYTPENDGHFGLNYNEYAHFTSPIRRYPDLLVHRAIRYLIRKNLKVPHTHVIKGAPVLSQAQIYPYDQKLLAACGEQCSMTERRADEATRDVINWLKCEFLLSRVGEEFAGVITSVTGFGLFVQLNDMYIEGLVHITGLPKDYYCHEAAHHRLVGERTGKIFRLGDELRVMVVRVDLNERKIDFGLVDKDSKASGRVIRDTKKNQKLNANNTEAHGKKKSSKKLDSKVRSKRKKAPRKNR
tara:strand:- start:193 stop:927 length:735 start_codon:yes stop_codon:yes gene_type:complete